jgi:hypothetical protein
MTGLAEERRLLVACDPGHRDLAAELGGGPVHLRGGDGLRQGRRVDAEEVAELPVPGQLADIEESVRWRPVSLKASQESIVPKTAPSRAASTFSRSHWIFVPEK